MERKVKPNVKLMTISENKKWETIGIGFFHLKQQNNKLYIQITTNDNKTILNIELTKNDYFEQPKNCYAHIKTHNKHYTFQFINEKMCNDVCNNFKQIKMTDIKSKQKSSSEQKENKNDIYTKTLQSLNLLNKSNNENNNINNNNNEKKEIKEVKDIKEVKENESTQQTIMKPNYTLITPENVNKMCELAFETMSKQNTRRLYQKISIEDIGKNIQRISNENVSTKNREFYDKMFQFVKALLFIPEDQLVNELLQYKTLISMFFILSFDASIPEKRKVNFANEYKTHLKSMKSVFMNDETLNQLRQHSYAIIYFRDVVIARYSDELFVMKIDQALEDMNRRILK